MVGCEHDCDDGWIEGLAREPGQLDREVWYPCPDCRPYPPERDPDE